MTELCEQEDCSDDAAFAFYNPRTGEVSLLCTEHLDAADEFFDVRTWVTAGYATPVEQFEGPGQLPRTPRRFEEQEARRAVDSLLRGNDTGHHH